MKPLHVIFGTGPLGRSVLHALNQKEVRIRMVNRTGLSDVSQPVEIVKSNILTGEGLNEAVAGASIVYQCANPPYNRWVDQFPTMQSNILNAAAAVNAKVVIGENVYMYGDTDTAVMTEDSPYAATTRKGIVRAQMAMDAITADKNRTVRVTIGRGSDFFGPFATNSMMGERQIGRAVRGTKASLVGNIDVPHSFTYINDFGRALVSLALNDSADRNVWHVPNAPALTQREFMNCVFSEIGREPAMSAMGRLMMRIGGVFIPEARESVEMMYQFEKPFIVDSTKFEKQFGWSATDISVAIKETVVWYKQQIKR
jgi:nucleoside-diphosphate-sugar epimerase